MLIEVEHLQSAKERNEQNEGPWFVDDRNKGLTEQLEIMTSRCFVQHIQQSTVRGCSTENDFSHKMFAGSEIFWSICMIVVVGKRYRQGEWHVCLETTKQFRLTLMWVMRAEGRQAVVSMDDRGYRIACG